MKSASRISVFLGTLILLCAPHALFAQSIQQPALPHLNISNIVLDKASYKEGDTVSGTFTIQNYSSSATPDITYIISLVGLGQGGHATRVVYGEKRMEADQLDAKSTVTVPFSYSLAGAPSDPTLGINVRAILSDNTSLAWAVTPVKMTGGLSTAQPVGGTVDYNGTSYPLGEGPTIAAGKDAFVSASYKSLSAITATPEISLADVSGNPIAANFPAQSPVHLTGATTTVRIKLPTSLKAGTYLAKVSLVDAGGNHRAPDLFARYIIGGDVVSIQYVYSGTQFPIENQKPIVLTLGYTGNPLNINSTDPNTAPSAASAPVSATLNVQLFNESNQSVGQSTSVQQFNGQGTIMLPVTLTGDSQNLSAQVTVSENGTTIGSYRGTVVYNAGAAANSPEQDNSKSILVLSAFSVLIILGGLFAMKKWRMRPAGFHAVAAMSEAPAKTLTKVIVALVISAGVLGTVHTVFANDFHRTSSDNIQNFEGGPPDTVAPGAAFDVNVTFQMLTCTNSTAWISADTNLEGAQKQHIEQDGSGLYDTWVQLDPSNGFDSDYYSDYQDVWLGKFTAPMADGTYKVNTSISDMWTGAWGTGRDGYIKGYWNVLVDTPPKGAQESSMCTATVGWACDGTNYSQPTTINVYTTIQTTSRRGRITTTKVLQGSVTASQERADVGPSCGGTTNHGFSFPTPDSLKDNLPHTIVASVVDIPDGSETDLGSMTIQCAPPCGNGLDIGQYPSCTCPAGQTQSGSSCITPGCTNGLDITQYPSCTCPSGQVQSGSSCVVPPSTCSNGLDVTQYPSCSCPAGQSQSGSGCVASSCTNGLDISQYPSCACPTGQTQSGSICTVSACSNGLNVAQYPSCSCPTGQYQSGTTCIPGCASTFMCQGSDIYHQLNSCAKQFVQTCQWGCTNAACNPMPAADATITAVPILVAQGNKTQVSWTSTDVIASSCSVGGGQDSWTGDSGSQLSHPITSATTYTLSCLALDGTSFSKSVNVNIAPTVNEL